MKRKILLMAAIAMSSIFIAHTQIVPNKSLENWIDSTLYEEPTGYWSSNSIILLSSFGFGQPNVEKSTDANSGNYSLKVTTMNAIFQTIPGIASNGQVGGGGFMGGIPFTERPDSIKASLKYNIPDPDTGFILVILKNSGSPISFNMIPITGQQSSWTEMIFPLNKPFVTPDSLFVAFFSGNPEKMNTAGNFMMVDDVELIGTTGQLNNPGFENWDEFGFEDPAGWSSFNLFITIFGGTPNVTKTNDAYDGNYAMSIKTSLFSFGGGDEDTIGFAATSSIENIGGQGGFPLSSGKPDSLVLWYKYIPANATDTALAMMIMTKYNTSLDTTEVVDSNLAYLVAASSYTRASIVFASGGETPDSANVIVASSNFISENGIGIGSELIVDNFLLFFGSVGLPMGQDENISLYPNPASDQLNLEMTFARSGQLKIKVFSLEGRLVREQTNVVTEGKQSISVETTTIENGSYLLQLQFEDEDPIVRKFHIIH